MLYVVLRMRSIHRRALYFKHIFGFSEILSEVQYVSVIAWVFDFRKFIIITDVSLQAMYILVACAPIASIQCSQHGLTHERLTKYLGLIPWGVE